MPPTTRGSSRRSPRSLRAHDPRAPIVVGAMAPAVDAADGSEQSPRTFLDAFYEAGPRPLDVRRGLGASVLLPGACRRATQPWNTFAALPDLHDLMDSHGDGGTRLWLTEFGAPTGTSESAVSDVASGVDPRLRAPRPPRASTSSVPLYLYSFRDAGTDPTDPEANFGVTTRDGRAKPAFWALRRELRKD